MILGEFIEMENIKFKQKAFCLVEKIIIMSEVSSTF